MFCENVEDFYDLGIFCPSECINPDDAQLTLEPRETLTDEEKELADIHLTSCLSCQMDFEFDRLIDQMEKE